MKTIQSVPIWNNGVIKNGEVLTCQVVSDNLATTATFYYRILTIDLLELATGNIVMEGSEYDAYDTNEYAWNWLSNKLGLVIIEETTTTTTTII